MPRFLHTADWQIGRSYQRFPAEDAALLAEARLNTVARIAHLAVERRADAVLVAGDVFDAQAVSDRTVRRLFDALAAFPGPWLMISGNHDAALAAGVWARARRLECMPENLRFLGKPGATLLESLGCMVLAAPLTQRQTHSDITAWFDDEASPPGLIRIGLAHGSVTGVLPESADSANPIAADRAVAARLDYLALGDWHGTRRIDARTWYSGTPEPDRFRANQPGNVLQVDIAGPGEEPVVEVVPVASYRWLDCEHDIGVGSDIDAVERLCRGITDRDVVALRLAGQVDMADRRRIDRLLEVSRGRARAMDVDLTGLRMRPTDADVAALAADGYLGEVLAQLRDAALAKEGRVEQAGVARAPAREGALAAGSVAGGSVAGDALANEALNILASVLLERKA